LSMMDNPIDSDAAILSHVRDQLSAVKTELLTTVSKHPGNPNMKNAASELAKEIAGIGEEYESLRKLASHMIAGDAASVRDSQKIATSKPNAKPSKDVVERIGDSVARVTVEPTTGAKGTNPSKPKGDVVKSLVHEIARETESSSDAELTPDAVVKLSRNDAGGKPESSEMKAKRGSKSGTQGVTGLPAPPKIREKRGDSAEKVKPTEKM
jgi:hypothetical protein